MQNKNLWKIIYSFKNKEILDKEIVEKNLTRTFIISFLSQDKRTISIAHFISKNLFFEDIYTIYLYALSKYPKGLFIKFISNKQDEDISILNTILNSNINDVINILKTLEPSKLKIVKKEYYHLKKEDKSLDLSDLEDHFLNLI